LRLAEYGKTLRQRVGPGARFAIFFLAKTLNFNFAQPCKSKNTALHGCYDYKECSIHVKDICGPDFFSAMPVDSARNGAMSR
jgi:hypothetical protein